MKMTASNIAKTLTGAGIGVGVACKFKASPLVTISATVAGMIGAFPSAASMDSLSLGKPGEPLGAFVAALAAIELGQLISGRTKIDIIITPFLSIGSGAIVGFLVGPPITKFMNFIGTLVNVNVQQHPIIGGIVVSVLMGMILTLPISSAAIGISMGIREALNLQATPTPIPAPVSVLAILEAAFRFAPISPFSNVPI